MENLIKALENTKKCFSQYQQEDIMKMNKNYYDKICIDEKLELSKIIFDDANFSTKIVIKERLNVLEDRRRKQIELRRKLLEN